MHSNRLVAKLSTALIATLFVSAPLHGEPLNYDQLVQAWKLCSDVPGDAKSCTLLIDRGGLSGQGLVIAFHNRAVQLKRQGFSESAIGDWSEAIRIRPEGLYYYLRGVTYLELNNPTRALLDSEASIKHQPDYSEAYNLKGQALLAFQNYDGAIAAFNAALELDGRNAGAYFDRGHAYYHKRQFDEAVADYNRALGVDEHAYNDYLVEAWIGRQDEKYIKQFRATAYSSIGNVYFAQANFEKAVRQFDASIKIYPSSYALYWRGQAYGKLGKRIETFTSYNEFIKLEFDPVSFPVIDADDMPSTFIFSQAVQFAWPPLPSEVELKSCLESQSSNSDEFYRCVVGRAFPKEYRLASACLAENKDDSGRAFLCSTERKDLLKAYDEFQAVRQCAEKSKDNTAIALCAGKKFLGKEEQYYVSCIANNQGDYKSMAVCAVTKGLNPEQQIALSCAISTGGQPHAFAVCTGGQLLQRELEKCWKDGMRTKDGCFGPNNEYVKFINQTDAAVKGMLGKNSEAYKAWKLWKDDVLAPGPKHEAIKAFNTILKDTQNGLGPNNDLAKFARNPTSAIKTVGKKIKLRM